LCRTMLIRLFLGLCLVGIVSADLRMASHPRNGYGLGGGGGGGRCSAAVIKAGKCFYRYMIPSVFSYSGLKYPGGQKYNNYDNFLRSNIDNEQDNRNFDKERGEDHLPFRTLRTEVDTTFSTNRFDGQKPRPKDLRKTVNAGESLMVPLRWNNPHAGEMEVNIWIFDHGTGNSPNKGKNPNPIVIPIRKPTCSAEGHQDHVIGFTIPKDFTKLGGKIPGFKGCNKDSVPMCTLQIYSHSVESRQYALAFPIIIPGHEDAVTTASTASVASVSKDPWMDMGSLRGLCLSTADPSATIHNAVPRWARLVSDVYTHAYMNSNQSPYSGQQHEFISQNLQASAINKMVSGNRGELGASILTNEQATRINQLASLEDTIYKNYESLANSLIKRLGNKMANSATFDIDGEKSGTARCFRCAEVGATTASRQETNTYIPSFQLPDNLLAQARAYVPSKYSSLITSSGVVQIYSAALADLAPFFFVSHPLGITYLTAQHKEPIWKRYNGYGKWQIQTKADATDFIKRDATGKTDKGQYASTMAKTQLAMEFGCAEECLMKSGEGCIGQTMKPAFAGSMGTCVAGAKCEKCAKLFDAYVVRPPPWISPLAKLISASGLPAGFGKDMPASYPDTDGSPRFGRPSGRGQKIILPTNATWDLSKPTPSPATPAPTAAPTPAPTTTAAPMTTTKAPNADAPVARRRRRRSGPRRRRRRTSGGTTRRRSGKGSRRRKSKSTRRRKSKGDVAFTAHLLQASLLGDVEPLPEEDCE